MISWLLKKFSGRHYRKFLEKARPIVARINEIEATYHTLTDEQLRAKTDEFRARIKAGETLDAILPEAFATVKNAASRLCGRTFVVCEHELEWNMVHFDVQLIGGLAIHQGRIAEMATGEGKTLVSTLPLYLNSLNGRNAQLVTVNDYLARRDSEWMGALYNFLGVTVGCIQQQMPNDLRREMYSRDITYGTASEFGFDYLRDNGMALSKQQQVQREHWYCIVDEIDSILVDEARVPLIISGPAPIEREQPFTRLKPDVEKLAAAQTRLCNHLISEARKHLERPTPLDASQTAEVNRLLSETQQKLERATTLLAADNRQAAQLKNLISEVQDILKRATIPDESQAIASCNLLSKATEILGQAATIPSTDKSQIAELHRLVSEVRNILIYATPPSSDEIREAALKMLQVKLGAPANKQLLHLFENPDWRKLLDKVETEMHSDFQKEQLYRLKEELYFSIDERQHQADLSLKGRNLLRPDNPDAFVLPDLATQFSVLEKDERYTPDQRAEIKHKAESDYSIISEDIHSISQLLRAYSLYEKDVEYVVQDGKVMIVDENTGRVMVGRRWSDGLHQAIEAKENVEIEAETRTYATITIQNYFRMYEKLAGMTGTAETEATEFNDIYKLAVQVIPTNKPCIRIDKNDSIYKTRRDKFNAVVREIESAHRRGQPVLVGTASVESSEVLSRMLKRTGIIHTVLNAKFHAQEADIIARAGQRGSVTIATNMAGRGTDIKLGEGVRFNVTHGAHPDPEKAKQNITQYTLTEPRTGEIKKYDSDSQEAYDLMLTPQTKETGGLYVIGTERHQSRRVDRQLRGRCSRQGDPGLTKFYLSLEDELMRLFLQGNLASRLMEGTMKEGEELQHPWLNRSIEGAQKKVEQQNFSARKRTLQYDDVFNLQRQVIYNIRNAAIDSERAKDIIFEQVDEELANRIAVAGVGEKSGTSQTSLENLAGWVNSFYPIGLKTAEIQDAPANTVKDHILNRVKTLYNERENNTPPDLLAVIERHVVISAIDQHWQEHLTEMESLRQSVGLRSYGQKDPLVEYKSEAYTYFEQLMNDVRLQICRALFQRSDTTMGGAENIFITLSRNATLQGPDNPAPALAGAAPARPVARVPVARVPEARPAAPNVPDTPAEEIHLPKVTIRREFPKVGRNDPCPCGSGKKYKNCHGKM